MNEKTLRYDAVIVGGGHNGLVCGAYLAKMGKKVCVLEKRPMLGGAAATEEIWDEYRVNTASHMMGLLQPRIILDLELTKFGFEVIALLRVMGSEHRLVHVECGFLTSARNDDRPVGEGLLGVVAPTQLLRRGLTRSLRVRAEVERRHRRGPRAGAWRGVGWA